MEKGLVLQVAKSRCNNALLKCMFTPLLLFSCAIKTGLFIDESVTFSRWTGKFGERVARSDSNLVQKSGDSDLQQRHHPHVSVLRS